MKNATIMIQDVGGNWMPVRIIESINDRYILQQMKLTSTSFPGKRVKVVDDKGNLIDLMGQQMFKVVRIEADDCYAVHTFFRSKIERECWNFIRNRLTNQSKHTRDVARELHVFNSLDEFCEQPEDIRVLKNVAYLTPPLDKRRIFAQYMTSPLEDKMITITIFNDSKSVAVAQIRGTASKLQSVIDTLLSQDAKYKIEVQ